MLLEGAEAREPTAPTIVADASVIPGAERLGQHAYASLLMSTGPKTELHSIAGNTPVENGVEAWRGLAIRRQQKGNVGHI